MPEPITDLITFIYTRDLAAADRFYRTTLGLPLTLDQGGCRIYRAGDAAFIGVCERPDAPADLKDASTGRVIITFVTDQVDEWFQRAIAAGAAVDKPPALNAAYGIYHAFVRDPSGYRIEFQRFLDPDWRRAGDSYEP